MEIKDVKLKLKIKSNKVTKVLHLLTTDSIADFQREHPRIVPSLLSSLAKGDTEKALEKIDLFIDLVSGLKDSLDQIKKHIIESMPPVHKDEKFGGKSFIDPDGNVVQKLSNKEDMAVIAGPPRDMKPIKKGNTKKEEE